MADSLKHIAYRHLRQRLLSGELRPGSRISPETSARELGMSATPVREAIGLLESDGLVEQVGNVGAFVRRIDRREMGDLFDLRIQLESFAAARAARRLRAGGAALKELRRLIDRMREIVRAIRDAGEDSLAGPLGAELAFVDASFHLAIMRGAGNVWVLKTVDNLQLLSRLMSVGTKPAIRSNIAAETALLLRQHWEIYQAVRRRDAISARRAMRDSLRLAKRVMLDDLDATPLRIGGEELLRDLRAQERKAVASIARPKSSAPKSSSNLAAKQRKKSRRR